MTSAKKSDPFICRKCNILLSNENWKIYDQNNSNYICYNCRKITDKQYKLKDLNNNKKQKDRYHYKKSAVINAYGDSCIKCGEDNYYKLTITHINKSNSIKNIYDYLYNNTANKDGYYILCYNCNYDNIISFKDKYALRDKKKVIRFYGNKCLECNEKKTQKLIITYKNNDDIKKHRHTGIKFYRWIIKNNYPMNLCLEVLCYNCYFNRMAKNKFTEDII